MLCRRVICRGPGSWGLPLVAGSTAAHPHPLAAALLCDATGGTAKAPRIFPGLEKLPLRETASHLGKGGP